MSGYFMMDNADNNDTAIDSLSLRIQDDGREGFEAEERRLRCFAHTINLAVKALLFGPKGVPKLKSDDKGKLQKVMLTIDIR